MALEKIYAAVPDVACKGLCVQACGPIAMSKAEETAIQAKHGQLPTASGLNLTCSSLENGKCAIYEARPLVCRVYGAVREMRCPYGCAPKGGFMASRDARKLFKRAEAIKVVDAGPVAAIARQADIASVVERLGSGAS